MCLVTMNKDGSLVSLFLHSAAILALASAAAGCTPSNPSTDDSAEDEGQSSDDALSAGDAVSRADQWVNAQLHYCQSANHQRDYDTACSKYCERTDNAQWNPYRSDCSGLVSWAWGLPAPGRVTSEFAPYNNAVSHTISGSDLEPGDALNSSDHIILFKNWNTKGESATFIEEPGCSTSIPYAHEFTSDVSVNGSSVYVGYEGKSFTSIRYNAISEGPPPKPTEPIAPKPKVCGVFEGGQGLGPGESVQSCDGRFDLVMQTDGNLVLYMGQKPLWATGTNGRGGYAMWMQTDGNFVLYDGYGAPLWDAHSEGHPGALLDVQNDGNLVVYSGNKPLWNSGTYGH